MTQGGLTWGGAAAIWSLLFAVMHFFWVYAYYAWPAAGRAMLGPMFDRAFASPRFRAYDLVAGGLFFVAGLAALASVRASDLGRARIVRAVLWLAAVLFTVRGIAGILLDTMIVLGVVRGTLIALCCTTSGFWPEEVCSLARFTRYNRFAVVTYSASPTTAGAA